MKEKATAFAVGATGYPCIEILARGHTHWSMALLGGICVLALVWIARRYPGMNIAVQAALGTVNAEAILAAGVPSLQALGMTFRKAAYITDFAERVHTGAFDLDAVAHMSDEAAIRALSSLKGIGVWTAEMILLFCLQRPDIFSYDDLAIRRGLRMVYHHREIDRDLFEKYRRRFCPYCSVASLYLWAVSGGAIPEMKDYKQKSK